MPRLAVIQESRCIPLGTHYRSEPAHTAAAKLRDNARPFPAYHNGRRMSSELFAISMTVYATVAESQQLEVDVETDRLPLAHDMLLREQGAVLDPTGPPVSRIVRPNLRHPTTGVRVHDRHRTAPTRVTEEGTHKSHVVGQLVVHPDVGSVT